MCPHHSNSCCRKCAWLPIAFTAVLLLASSTSVPAQPYQAQIKGRLETDDGQPLPQVTVMLWNQQAGERLQATTDVQGMYSFSTLVAGSYRLEVHADGYQVETRDKVLLDADTVLEINFILSEERKTIREAEERGAEERNPNIFIRRIDLNALRDPYRRRGIDPVFISFSALENNYGVDLGSPIRQFLYVIPGAPKPRFHGSVYEAHQNSHLNARPFFNVGPLRPSKRNQFGLSATGPVLRDQLFFITTLDFIRESGYVNGNIRSLYPSERVPNSGDPATDEILRALLQAYPAEDPNLPDVAPRQLNTNAMRRIRSMDWNFKLDHPMNQNDKLALRYTLSDFKQDPYELVIGQNPKTDMRSQSFSFTHAKVWTPRTTLQSSYYFDRLAAQLVLTEQFRNLLQSSGLTDVPDISFGGSMADLTSIGPGSQFPRFRFQNRFMGNFDGAHQTGRHNIRFGGRITRIQLNDLQSDNSRGKFVFSNNFGRTPVENLLRGTPNKFTVTLGDLYRGFRNWEYALYVQDTCQLRRGMTMTLGLRYEVISVPIEVADRTQFDFKTDANNFAPQVGFAWVPFSEATIIRAGYGISFGQIYPGTYQQGRFNPPAVWPISVQNPSLLNPLKDLTLTPELGQRSELNLLSPDLVTPYSHQYNLSIERRLSLSTVFKIGYAGNRTLKVFFPLITNRAEPVPGIPATTATVDERRPDPRYLNILTIINSGMFYYDGMKLDLTHSSAAGLALDLSYTLSKALTSTSDFAATLNSEAGTNYGQNITDYMADLKGPSPFDHRHILTARFSYQLPFKFVASRLASTFLQGWRVMGTTELRTGQRFMIETSSDAPGFGNVDGVDGDRPNITNLDILGKTFDNPDTSISLMRPEFFDTIIEPGGSGNEPIYPFRKDTINNTNLTISKTFMLSGSERSLQFNAEFSNLFNHALFDRPGDVFPSQVFGKIADTQNKGRVIQIMVKYSF